MKTSFIIAMFMGVLVAAVAVPEANPYPFEVCYSASERVL